MATPFRLDGRTALVTGGASGIGEQVCRVLTGAGATVTIADIDGPRAEALAAGLTGASALIFDVTDEAAVNRAVGSRAGLNILVNSAGVGLVGGIEETTAADFERLFRVNVEGTYLVMKAAMPHLLAFAGAIVNIGSVAGMVGVKRRFAYCPRAPCWRCRGRWPWIMPAGCRRTASVPALWIRPSWKPTWRGFTSTKRRRCARSWLRASRWAVWAAPRKWPTLVLYLCSAEAEFVTGSTPTIDGGWTARRNQRRQN